MQFKRFARRTFRKLLGIFPAFVRHKLIRRFFKITHHWPEQLEIRPAANDEEAREALLLLHDCYVDAKLISARPDGLRALLHHLLPHTTIIMVLWSGELIGTVSLIEESAFGLPMETTFDLEKRKLCGNRLAELSSLAIAAKHRGKAQSVLFPLLKYLYQFSLQSGRIDEITIAVEPKMADLYQALMLYRPISKRKRRYASTNFVRAIALYRELKTVESDSYRIYGKAPRHRNLWAYFKTEFLNSNQFQKAEAAKERQHYMTPKLMEQLLFGGIDLKDVSDEEMRQLQKLYPASDYQKVFSKFKCADWVNGSVAKFTRQPDSQAS